MDVHERDVRLIQVPVTHPRRMAEYIAYLDAQDLEERSKVGIPRTMSMVGGK